MGKVPPDIQQDLLTLGAHLRTVRRKRGLTLQSVSERMQVNVRTVSKIEKGDPSVTLLHFLSYLAILGLSKGWGERLMGEYMEWVAPRPQKAVFSDKDMDF